VSACPASRLLLTSDGLEAVDALLVATARHDRGAPQVVQMGYRLTKRQEAVKPAQSAAEHDRQQFMCGTRLATGLDERLQLLLMMRAKIRDARIPYRVPPSSDLPDRLDAVLQVRKMYPCL